jgi:lipoate---protein ligase
VTSAWVARERTGAAEELADQAAIIADAAGGRLVRLAHVNAAALVLGSSQPDSVVDRRRLGPDVSVVRRRTGGGAVWVAPREQVWLDVWLPPDDPLAVTPDVVRSSVWVGERCAVALAALGLEGLRVHQGPWLPGRWGRLVCFGGRGPGEVVCGGRKVLGLAQRRTREGRWFQLMVPTVWDPAHWSPLLRPGPAEIADGGGTGESDALAAALTTLVAPTLLDGRVVQQALVAALR